MLFLMTRHQRVLQKKIYSSTVKHDVTTSKLPFFCHFWPRGVYLKQFLKTIFMSIRPIPVPTRVLLEILQLSCVMFDIRCQRRALCEVKTGWHLSRIQVIYRK